MPWLGPEPDQSCYKGWDALPFSFFSGPAAPGPFEQSFVILSCGPQRDLFAGSSSKFSMVCFGPLPLGNPWLDTGLF